MVPAPLTSNWVAGVMVSDADLPCRRRARLKHCRIDYCVGSTGSGIG